MLTETGGAFVKIAFAADAHLPLMRGRPDRPAGRFNRPGQDALYLSPDEGSARVAIGQYVGAGDPPRVLLAFRVGICRLVDLRHPSASAIHSMARLPWRTPLAEGREPPSWVAADRLRAAGHVGLIDPSRRQPGLWHVTLFRWNAAGAPQVVPVGAAEPIAVSPDPG